MQDDWCCERVSLSTARQARWVCSVLKKRSSASLKGALRKIVHAVFRYGSEGHSRTPKRYFLKIKDEVFFLLAGDGNMESEDVISALGVQLQAESERK